MLEPRKIRQFLAVAIILAGISLVAVIAGKFSGRRQSAPVSTSPAGNADVALRKIHFSETSVGGKKWELVADSADYDRGSGIARLQGVMVQVVGEPLTGDVVLTAARAEYNTTSKEVHLTGNVLVKTAKGVEVVTSSATYQGAAAMVKTDAPVRLSDAEMTVSGVGLELNTATRSVHILRNVEANLKGRGNR